MVLCRRPAILSRACRQPIGDTSRVRISRDHREGQMFWKPEKARLLLVGEMREGSLEKVAFEPGLEDREDYFPFHKGNI